MKKKKLKVVWFCYFTNTEIQDQIKPYRRIGEIAPWISAMIPLFENNGTVELHVVSQHEWISGYKHFEKNGVFYHFIHKGIPVIGRHWPGFFKLDILTDYFYLKKKFTGIANKIGPDIIHMHGTENEFCTAITQFYRKYPVFITIQGFIHKTSAKHKSLERRIQKEFEIIKMFNHYGYRTETMGKDIKSLNPDAELHWHSYPFKPVNPINIEKKFDLVFFANITKDKGIEDLLKAVAIIKKDKPDVSLCVIGKGNSAPFKKLALALGIQDNIFWAGFLPTQNDVHKLASAARISVLPTYHDIISGTIVESLFLQLPVVAYNVGSIHEVNKNNKIISLVEKNDVDGLAKAIMVLLNDDILQKERALLGFQRAKKIFTAGNEEISIDLLKIYKAVIDDFYKL